MVFCILLLTTRPVRVRAPRSSSAAAAACGCVCSACAVCSGCCTGCSACAACSGCAAGAGCAGFAARGCFSAFAWVFFALTSYFLRRRAPASAAAPSSHAQCCAARRRTDAAWAADPSRAACAARTAPCAASRALRSARPATGCEASAGTGVSHRSSSAHLPFHKRSGHGQLRAGEAEGFTSRDLVDALHLEQHLARLYTRHVVLDVALARAHADLERLLGDRHVREDTNPDLAAALHVARHGTPSRLDLACRHARAAGGLEAELAEGHVAAARREAAVAALELLAVLGAFGLKHCRLVLTSGLRRCIRWRARGRRGSRRCGGRRRRCRSGGCCRGTWGGLAFSGGLLEIALVEHLALEDPHLDADHAVSGARFGEAVVDVGAEGMQRNAPLAVPLGTRDLRAVEAPRDAHFHTEGARAHGAHHRALHGAAKHNALL